MGYRFYGGSGGSEALQDGKYRHNNQGDVKDGVPASVTKPAGDTIIGGGEHAEKEYSDYAATDVCKC